jgi:hypothetical protein
MRTTAQAARERRQLMKEIAAEHKKRDRAKLAELKANIRNIKARRKKAMKQVVFSCRVGRVRARDRAKERVRQLREQMRAEIRRIRTEEKAKARSLCKLRKAKVKAASMTAREQRRAILRAERRMQQEIRDIDMRMRRRERKERPTAKERQGESDDAVRHNIPPELVALFERVKRQIRGSEHMSRTEDFLHYAEENPAEVVDAQEELSRRELARLVREEHTLKKALRDPNRYRVTAAELAAVPF